MSTFQAIVYSIIQAFSEFLPISHHAHRVLVPELLHWPVPEGTFLGAVYVGLLLSLLVYFRHDWASIVSSFLQVIIFRKRPMTLDERLPFFFVLSALPAGLAFFYFDHVVRSFFENPYWVAAGLALFGLPLYFADSMSRKNKNMFDWSIIDTLTIGIANVFLFVPGVGRMTASLTGAMFRNYSREAAVKYSLYASLPFLICNVYMHMHGFTFHAPQPMADMSWFTFWVTVLVSMISGMLAMGGILKSVHYRGFIGYWMYRILFAGAFAGIYWWRSRN